MGSICSSTKRSSATTTERISPTNPTTTNPPYRNKPPYTTNLTICVSDASNIVVANALSTNVVELVDPVTRTCKHSLGGHTGPVDICVTSHSHRHMATASHIDHTVRIWDISTGICGQTLQTRIIRACAFSADDKMMLIYYMSGGIGVWDINTGGQVCSFMVADYVVDCWNFWYWCVVSPVDTCIAVSARDGIPQIWDIRTTRRVCRLSEHAGTFAAAFSPVGGSMVTVSDDAGKMWDTHTGSCLYTMSGHTCRITCCDYSPDGSTIITGANDSTVRMWDAHTGACAHVLIIHPTLDPRYYGARIGTCRFSRDGSAVTTCVVNIDYRRVRDCPIAPVVVWDRSVLTHSVPSHMRNRLKILIMVMIGYRHSHRYNNHRLRLPPELWEVVGTW